MKSDNIKKAHFKIFLEHPLECEIDIALIETFPNFQLGIPVKLKYKRGFCYFMISLTVYRVSGRRL